MSGDISGQWQGSTVGAERESRIVLKIWMENEKWNALYCSLDEGGSRYRIHSITFQDRALRFAVGRIRYEGELSSDSSTITGVRTILHSRPLNFERATTETAWKLCSSPHTQLFIPVDNRVSLEVLDWGGRGRPLMLLAGLESTAHTYDEIAPRLTERHHVYGITRRGHGESSLPCPIETNYSAERLADDVLAVIEALKVNRPILAGASIAGQELTSIGSRCPEKVAGLIYLDAGYWYSHYNSSNGDIYADALDVRRKLESLALTHGPRQLKTLVQELLEVDLPLLERHLHAMHEVLQMMPDPPSGLRDPVEPSPVRRAVLAGGRKFAGVGCPVLAIFAYPVNFAEEYKDDPGACAAAETMWSPRQRSQVKAFEEAMPSARVVRLANAKHVIYKSNEEDVLREIDAFIAQLPD